ncbi:hypothetical protein SO802_019973 [Lithocarpus litseifolius]|uniref:60S ribosomal protein L7a n=1 Tax=Lithocarpus litseifolius TaxID=425828 RepID=A0AAW2CCQ2_9ROSI
MTKRGNEDIDITNQSSLHIKTTLFCHLCLFPEQQQPRVCVILGFSSELSEMAPKRGGKVSAAPAKKKTEKVLNPLFEKRSKQFGIGGALPPKRDLHRFVNWPVVVRLQRKKCILKQRFKVPPALNPFTKTLEKNPATNSFKLLLKYRPEDKSAKKECLLKRDQAEAEGKTVEAGHCRKIRTQPCYNKAQLVVIAHDVDPIELVVWLPALCRKMEIPYCIVKGKSRLGSIVHKKTASVLCLTTVRNEDKLEFSKILEALNANFNDKYDEYRKKWGGGIVGSKSQAKTKGEGKTSSKGSCSEDDLGHKPRNSSCVLIKQGVSVVKALGKSRWEKPEVCWMKLNTDGALNSLLGLAGGGGLIRDDAGRWVAGFARKIGKINSFLAELLALRDGLFLCQQMNVTTLVIELDGKGLVDAFTNPSYSNAVVSSLFDDCKQLVTRLSYYRIKHVFREANMCADQLARLGCLQVSDFTLYSCLPVDIMKSFEVDSQGPRQRVKPLFQFSSQHEHMY